MKIASVKKDSQAERKGLRAGDRIVEIDGSAVRDCIDLMFYGSDDSITMTLHRGTYEFKVMLSGSEDFGFELEPMNIKTCGNNCLFCFIEQNPPGMRKELYIKDEDYRLSFLHGAYVTLTDLSEYDLQRIAAQRLSPLYVSVHATDTETRLTLLGVRKDDNLLANMDRLLAAGITMHCQIVVCPGINDGEVLKQTVTDLRRRYPQVLSVAVVPVGLTKHREGLYSLKGVNEEDARDTIALVDSLHDQFARETDGGFVFCADEWYIRAGLDVPFSAYYEDYPQIENGVGMVRNFIDSIYDINGRLDGKIKRRGNFVFVTGISMAPHIYNLSRALSEYEGLSVRTLTVRNDFYGDSITVSGLLTGRDIQSALEGTVRDETVVLPPNCLNESGVFLDDTTPEVLSEVLGVPVIQGDYDPLKLFV